MKAFLLPEPADAADGRWLFLRAVGSSLVGARESAGHVCSSHSAARGDGIVLSRCDTQKLLGISPDARLSRKREDGKANPINCRGMARRAGGRAEILRASS